MLPGKVANVASPTRNTLKSSDRFLYPAVVKQKHTSGGITRQEHMEHPLPFQKIAQLGIAVVVINDHVVGKHSDVIGDGYRQIPKAGIVEIWSKRQARKLPEVIFHGLLCREFDFGR